MSIHSLAMGGSYGMMQFRGPAVTSPVSLVTVPEPAPVEVGTDVAVAGSEIHAKIAVGWLGLMVVGLAAFYTWTHNHQG